MKRLFCFGFGYSACALVARLRPLGWVVEATATTPGGVQRIIQSGAQGYLFDGTAANSEVAAALERATHVVVSAPPDARGDPVLRHHGDALLASPSVGWIGYLSTIGVYGDWQGAWIDEDCTARPQSDRSVRRLAAEQAWSALSAASGKRVVSFRLAGIYGPGRSAIDTLREGTARRLIKPGQVFNRIHVTDIAGVLAAEIARPGRHAVYNVTDDEPAPPQDVVAYGAELLGLPIPPDLPYEAATLSLMAASFYSENKRASNARAKGDLDWTLTYPTYREGLAAIAAGLQTG
jgi:nucleoside-diphosphate-sugar epimerase